MLRRSNQTAIKNILTYSDVLITIYSTQIIEGAIFDVPVINAGYPQFREWRVPASLSEQYDHLRRVTQTRGATNCHSRASLMDTINLHLTDRGLLRAERKRLVDQEIDTNRGTAGFAAISRIIRTVELEW